MSRPDTGRYLLLAGSAWLASVFLALLTFAGLSAAVTANRASIPVLAAYVAALLLELGLAVLVVFLAGGRAGVPAAARLVVTFALGSLQLVTFVLLAFVGLLRAGRLE